MDTISIISLIVAVCLAVFTSITAPILLLHRTEKMHREDRQADYARQDEVAKKAAEAADDLVKSQKTIADQAAEAATLLLAANERVAKTAVETNDKLDVIHTLVNSNMTAAMQSEYDATVRELAMMKEVVELKRTSGLQPTSEVIGTIAATEAKLSELASALEDRARASTRIA